MGAGMSIGSARGQDVWRAESRSTPQLRLVFGSDDLPGDEREHRSSAEGADPGTPAIETLAAYALRLQEGDPCFCCGGVMAIEKSSSDPALSERSLSCSACGATVSRP